MANVTFDEKVDDLISKHVGGPKLKIGPDVSPYALVPRRDPNDPMDRFVFGNLQKVGFGPMLPEGYQGRVNATAATSRTPILGRGEAIPGARSQYHEGMDDMGFTDEARAIQFRQPGFGQRVGMELRNNLPEVLSRTRNYPGGPQDIEGLREASMSAMGVPRMRSFDEGMSRLTAAIPQAVNRPAIDPNSFGPVLPSSPERNIPGDITLAANRGPASGYSYNPRGEDSGNYEYGGKFNGKDVYFWKPQNDMQSIFNNAKSAIMEYQRRNPNDPMIGAVENLLNAMNINPNAESARNLQGAHADLYRGQAGAIPSEIEERGARAKYYGRENPFVLSPGQRAFVPGREPGGAAMRIAEGAEERPGTTGMEKMNEFDKVQYQAAAHIAQNSIDPEQQKIAFEKMDEIEKRHSRPQMDRNTAYSKLKATGKYTDDQINAKINSLGIR